MASLVGQRQSKMLDYRPCGMSTLLIFSLSFQVGLIWSTKYLFLASLEFLRNGFPSEAVVKTKTQTVLLLGAILYYKVEAAAFLRNSVAWMIRMHFLKVMLASGRIFFSLDIKTYWECFLSSPDRWSASDSGTMNQHGAQWGPQAHIHKHQLQVMSSLEITEIPDKSSDAQLTAGQSF